MSKVWRSKKNYLNSLQQSMRHFVSHLEHEERMFRALGGLTAALGNLQKACFVVPVVCVVVWH